MHILFMSDPWRIKLLCSGRLQWLKWVIYSLWLEGIFERLWKHFTVYWTYLGCTSDFWGKILLLGGRSNFPKERCLKQHWKEKVPSAHQTTVIWTTLTGERDLISWFGTKKNVWCVYKIVFKVIMAECRPSFPTHSHAYKQCDAVDCTLSVGV